MWTWAPTEPADGSSQDHLLAFHVAAEVGMQNGIASNKHRTEDH